MTWHDETEVTFHQFNSIYHLIKFNFLWFIFPSLRKFKLVKIKQGFAEYITFLPKQMTLNLCSHSINCRKQLIRS